MAGFPGMYLPQLFGIGFCFGALNAMMGCPVTLYVAELFPKNVRFLAGGMCLTASLALTGGIGPYFCHLLALHGAPRSSASLSCTLALERRIRPFPISVSLSAPTLVGEESASRGAHESSTAVLNGRVGGRGDLRCAVWVGGPALYMLFWCLVSAACNFWGRRAHFKGKMRMSHIRHAPY